MPPIKPQLSPSSLLSTLSRPCQPTHRSPHTHQVRHATLLRRPHRPYTFTQLMTLSDGSTFTHRTTSPLPVYKSNKDTRNTPLWNPSNAKMANVEEDEAGRLRAFRKRFGRGWDAEGARDEMEGLGLQAPESENDEVGVDASEALGERVEVRGKKERGEAMPKGQEELGTGRRRTDDDEIASASAWSDEGEDNLLDLISSFGNETNAPTRGSEPTKKPKSKK